MDDEKDENSYKTLKAFKATMARSVLQLIECENLSSHVRMNLALTFINILFS